MTRNRIVRWFWAAAFLAAFWCLANPPLALSQQNEKVILKMTWVYGATHAPAFVGVEKGIFKAAGLDAEVQDGRGSRDNLQLLAAGKLPVVFADAGTAAQFITQGVAAKAIYTHYQVSPMSIIVREGLGIKTPKDLEGKKVGRVAASSNTAIFPAVLLHNGIDASKINFVNAVPAAMATAFLNGEVDAILLHFPDNVANLRAKGAKVSYLRYADIGANTLGEGIVASEAFMKQKPDVVRRMMRAFSQSLRYALDHRDEAVAATQKGAPLTVKDPKVARQIVDGYLSLVYTKNSQGKPLGWMAAQDWEDTIQILTKYVNLKGARPAGNYYTNAFIAMDIM